MDIFLDVFEKNVAEKVLLLLKLGALYIGVPRFVH